MLLVREERSVFQSGLATIEIDVQKMLSTIWKELERICINFSRKFF
jgi:hypothetical protein